MPGPRFASFTPPGSYWQASRAPRYSLLFALPLLVFYQVLAVWLAAGPRSVRNGADVILQSLFTAVAGTWGPLLFMLCLIGGGPPPRAPRPPPPPPPPPHPARLRHQRPQPSPLAPH